MMLRVLCLLLWLPMAAVAQTYPEPLSDKINDYAGLLSPEAEARIGAALQAARNETGVHMVLAVIDRQADYGGTGRFADFATGWFNAWGIGDATRNDGVLILVSKGDREMRIALGRAYNPVWDGRAQRVIDQAMLPAFRNENYAEGLEGGAMMAIEQIARPFAANVAVTEDSGFPQDPVLPKVFGVLFTLLAALTVFGVMFRKWLWRVTLRFRRCSNCGARLLTFKREITVKPGETTRGQAEEHLLCSGCGHDRTTFHVISSKAEAREARESSSSSDFGGGSSGGGGASGKW
jgi:uncharacterized protein